MIANIWKDENSSFGVLRSHSEIRATSPVLVSGREASALSGATSLMSAGAIASVLIMENRLTSFSLMSSDANQQSSTSKS